MNATRDPRFHYVGLELAKTGSVGNGSMVVVVVTVVRGRTGGRNWVVSGENIQLINSRIVI